MDIIKWTQNYKAIATRNNMQNQRGLKMNLYPQAYAYPAAG